MSSTDAQPPRTRRETREQERGRKKAFSSGFATLRDVLSFLLGVCIIVNEVFFETESEATLIGLGIALTGLPIVLGADERKAR